MFNHILTLLLFSACCLRGESLSLDDVMSGDEQQAAGLSSLQDSQRAALEQWISNWTRTCINQARLYQPGESLQEWVSKLPLASQPVKKAPPEEIIAEQKELNQKIFTVRNDGAIIDLQDGSSWKIAAYETYKTRKWQRGDTIYPEKTTLISYPPYRLKNMTRRQFADASMLEPVSPTGVRAAPGEDYYAGSTRVTDIQNKGEFVFLADGTSWKICLQDQVRTKKWKAGDRIRHGTSTKDLLYPHSLENLDSGERVRGNSKEKRQ